jgi:Protein of unknown function (DUF3352)
MITPRRSRLLSLLICSALIAAPAAAQQRRPPPPTPKEATKAAPTPAPTLDTLLAADCYKVYGEIKNFGQLIHSGSVQDLLDPIMKLAAPPKEFKSLVKFANVHAETLTSSRMVFAAWPVRAKLPQFLMAIEFSSPDEVQKFAPQLLEFLPKIFPSPTPTPSPATTAAAAPAAASSPEGSPTPETEKPTLEAEKKVSEKNPQPPTEVKEEKPAPPPFVIQQLGNLILISDTTFTLRNLRPKDAKLLSEDQNFRQVRDRFATEAVFLYFDIGLEDKNRAAVAANEPQPKEVTEDPNQMPGDESEMVTPEVTPNAETPETQTESTFEVRVSPSTVVVAQNAPGAPPSPSETVDPIFYMLMGSFFGGQTKYPDAVGVAISFDADGYVARVLLVNGPEAKRTLMPFIPQLISGPSLTLESPSILPADTEFFVAASLDAPQIYDGLVKAINEAGAREAMYRRTRAATPPELPFAAFEKKLGIKIKDDLLPVLGNEIAVTFSVDAVTGKPVNKTPPTDQASSSTSNQDAAKKRTPSFVVLISVKDKEAARALVPRVIDGLGFKGASTLAQTERREDAEIISYGNALSYAFIGNFLVLSVDAAATRHVVDSYLNHQTLASEGHFRNSTRWQPRQVLGQVYVSPALMESFKSWANEPTVLISDQIRELLLRLSPVAEPVTYALSNEGVGPLHELHVPKNLVLMMVASISSATNQSELMRNENMVRYMLTTIATSEARYRADEGKGSYATLDQLIAQGMVQKELLDNFGYRIEVTVSGDKFEATAVPLEYNKTGRLSYFVDQSAIVRGGDHAGGPATVGDRPVQ